jgi:hypothetical protein
MVQGTGDGVDMAVEFQVSGVRFQVSGTARTDTSTLTPDT